MSTIVIMPGGFHPFHAGHAALYQSAVKAFPGAEVFVAATNDTSNRPFPFAIKEKLAKLAGVAPGHFVQVKSPFQAKEITAQFNPEKDRLIFVRSEKDADKPPQAGGVKKNGEPAYLQPLAGQTNIAPFAKHAYMAYLPTVEFGPGMTSATEIRSAWPQLNEKRKTALVMSLYPQTQQNPALAANVVKMLDAAIGTDLAESNMLGHVMFKSKPKHFKKIQPAVSRTKDFMKKDFSLSEEEELNEFAPSDGGDDRKHEYEVYQANLNDQFDWIGGPLYQSDDLGKAHSIAYELWKKHPDKMFMVWQERSQGSRGGYGPKGSELEPSEELNEFAPDEGGGARKFIPWTEFIEQLKQILHKDFSCKENIVKSTIKARFVPHDPMEYGPTMLYSYYETRAGGRNKGAISTRGSIQVGKYTKGGLFGQNPDQLLTGFHLLKGHPFERHFDLTFDNIYKIANIIQGNTDGALEFEPEGVAETNAQNFVGGMTASYQDHENQPIDEDYIDEKWSQKYKSSINCSNPKGFSQRAHCAGRKK